MSFDFPTFTSHIDKTNILTFLLKSYLYLFSLFENPSFIIFSAETNTFRQDLGIGIYKNPTQRVGPVQSGPNHHLIKNNDIAEKLQN
jgi:hypothetical protein